MDFVVLSVKLTGSDLCAQVAMRALGFDVKKADVLKILRDYDREGTGKISFDDFNETSELILHRLVLAFCSLGLGVAIIIRYSDRSASIIVYTVQSVFELLPYHLPSDVLLYFKICF